MGAHYYYSRTIIIIVELVLSGMYSFSWAWRGSEPFWTLFYSLLQGAEPTFPVFYAEPSQEDRIPGTFPYFIIN